MKNMTGLKKKKRKLNLVELSCGIVIFATIMITVVLGVNGVISKMTEDSNVNFENILMQAVEKYLSANSEFQPKALGESSYIMLKDLYENNLIKNDITNDKKETCVNNNSYVRVYKYSNNENKYLTYLYCGDDDGEEVGNIPEPAVEVKILNKKDRIIKNKTINVLEDKFEIDIAGGLNREGSAIGIDSYNFTIFGDNSEILYKSEDVKVQRESELVSRKFSDFIESTDSKNIKLVVTVRNVVGGEKSVFVKLKSEY